MKKKRRNKKKLPLWETIFLQYFFGFAYFDNPFVRDLRRLKKIEKNLSQAPESIREFLTEQIARLKPLCEEYKNKEILTNEDFNKYINEIQYLHNKYKKKFTPENYAEFVLFLVRIKFIKDLRIIVNDELKAEVILFKKSIL